MTEAPGFFLLLIFITVCLLTAPDKFDGTLIIMIVPSMIAIIAIPENTVINPTHQSVKSCIRYLCRALARLQISSLSFALC